MLLHLDGDDPMAMNPVETVQLSHWESIPEPGVVAHALDALESGCVLRLPLAFPLEEGEQVVLSDALLDGSRKNISYDPATGRLKGCVDDPALAGRLRAVMARYARLSASLLDNLLPAYRGQLEAGRTSYRPAEIAGRPVRSWRRDDTRLHVDAFPATPVNGRRLLRVFHNLNPEGVRRWCVGEPFPELARRFFGQIPPPARWQARLLALLGLTRSLRSPYDHYMLQLHDRMKADLDYQYSAGRLALAFAPGETWVVFSDQASHAVLGGQFMLEQTFYLPVEQMVYPERAPLRVLEKLAGRPLV